MPTRRMGRTRWPVVAPARLRSHERSISRSWKARTFSTATAKLSFRSKESDSTARSISLCGTRISCGRMPSKRSLYSRRAASPLSRTSSTIRRAASRTFSERNPPGRRNLPTTSRGSMSLASIFLTNGFSTPLHSVGQGHDLAVAQTVGAAVGDKTRRRGGDLIEHHQVVLVQGRARGGEVDDALCQSDQGRELYGAVQFYDLGLAAHPLEVAPRGGGELGRHPYDFGVADGAPHFLGHVLRGGQDHAAPPGAEVLQLYDVRPLLVEHVLADDTDVGGAVLDEDGHVGGPADDKLGVLCRVYEPASVLPDEGCRQPGPLERGERVGEDGAFRHGDPQPAQESTVLATDSGLIKTNSPAGSAVASLMPPGAG